MPAVPIHESAPCGRPRRVCEQPASWSRPQQPGWAGRSNAGSAMGMRFRARPRQEGQRPDCDGRAGRLQRAECCELHRHGWEPEFSVLRPGGGVRASAPRPVGVPIPILTIRHNCLSFQEIFALRWYGLGRGVSPLSERQIKRKGNGPMRMPHLAGLARTRSNGTRGTALCIGSPGGWQPKRNARRRTRPHRDT